ncbi:hypothetical protein DYQ86_04765 [Acidobacteria bacterium AB60]|nr:hypothetical protein DYQ86_04765 [Acidobacteria bacterium AB60]
MGARMETTEYRCVLVRPRSHGVLAFADAGQYRLPRVQIPVATRPAQEVQRASKAKWGLDIFVLETWDKLDGLGACAVAELLAPEVASSLSEVAINRLVTGELLDLEGRRLELLLESGPKGRLPHPGWIDEAIVWMESGTGHRFSKNVEQLNAGGGFLFRACSDDGRHYWLKATGEPNAHEFAIVNFLCQLRADSLPKLVASKPEWNAWLTEDAGNPLQDAPNAAELALAATCLARLQAETIGRTGELLAAGAFDQRLPAMSRHIDAVIDYLIDAMTRQTSTKAAPLSRDRLLELGEMLRAACRRLETLEIPDALIHNDLNPGNILRDGTRLVFTDWSEAAVGNPFVSCERLCQLNRAHAELVRNAYRECWSHRLSAETIDEAVILTPLLAIFAYLFCRGDSVRQRAEARPGFESYARSLARHMDRAAKDSSLLEVLCH